MSADPIEVKRAVARALKEKQKRLERAALERDLIHFMQSAWSAIEPGTFSLNWHHIEIAKALEQIRRGSLRNLVINIPPRCTKTLLVNVFYPAWLWAQSDIRPLSGPHVRFLCVSYGANLSEEIAVKMRRLIQTDWYQSNWSSRVQIAGDQQSRANFANTAGGERMSNSIEGGLLGRGGDIQICLPAYEIIHTEQGPLPIAFIVESKLQLRVWSYNEKQSTFELKPVIGWHTNPASDIVELIASFGKLHCTPNHKILTSKGWQRADTLSSNVVSHVDQTYCLTVADNHNMVAGTCLFVISNCDDPHSLIGAESPVQRTATLEGMRSLTTRITDPRINARILVMQRLHCLLPGVAVRTLSGQKPVEELTTDDTVLGSNGWQKITATSTMPFNGTAYGVRLFGHPEVCWTTPNHCYLTKRGWQRADELITTDWIKFPSEFSCSTFIPWEEPRRALPPSNSTGNFSGNTLSIPKEELTKLVDTGITNISISKILNVHRNTVHNHLWAYKIGRIREITPWFGREHLDDPLFWRLVGYWLAEGCFMKGRGIICGIRLTLHMDETLYQDDIYNVLTKYGVKVKQTIITQSKVCQIEANTSQLGRWLNEHFGSGARNKILPEFIFSLSFENRNEILEGWLRGDGCVRQTGPLKGQRAGTSSSISLIQGMQRLALSIGQRVNIVAGRIENKTIEILNWKGLVHKSWELRIVPEPSREGSMRSKIESDGIWYQVKTIETKSYDGIVYDITTPSHDFVVGNATIHNTDDATNYALDHWDKPRLYMFPMRFDERRASTYDPRSTEGELLWPEVWNEDAVAREERELAAYGIAGQLQQNPVPRGGGIIGRDDWRVWPDEAPEAAGLTAVYECKVCRWKGYMPDIDADSIGCPHCGSSAERAIPYPEFSFRLLSVDTSYGETQANSWSAATAWEVWHGKDGDPRAMLTYAWRGRPRLHEADGAIGLVERIHKIAQRRKSDVVLIEKKSRGVDLYNELARQSVEWPYRLEWFEPAGKGAGQIGESAKIMRLNAVVGLFTNNLVWAPKTDWAETVINEVADQPRAKYNDLCDTCSQALIYLRNAGYLTTGAEHKRDTARASVFRGRSSSNVSDEFEN